VGRGFRFTGVKAASMVVNYKSGPSHALGLTAKPTDTSGNVPWTWFVGTNTTLGSWPIDVSCGDTRGETAIDVS
jgi:micrococcal nuclease